MEIDFWKQRWHNDQIGFHQTQVNPYLAYFYGQKGLPVEKRDAIKVFVPLCGKSKDMLWLAQNGYSVFGVECSEKAVDAFFQENALAFRKAVNDDGAFYQSVVDQTVTDATVTNAAAGQQGIRQIEIYQGDFFSLQPEHLHDITDVFDRAALIAMPGDMRKAYVDKMAQILPPGTRILLVTLSYDQSEMQGPPFSVSEQEVNELYSAHFSVDKLLLKNVLEDEPGFKQRGLSALTETVYKLVRQ